MDLKNLQSLTIKLLPEPKTYVVARLPKDPPGSFVLLSSDPDDVALALATGNDHTTWQPGRARSFKIWAIVGYATSYAGVCGILDLLNQQWAERAP